MEGEGRRENGDCSYLCIPFSFIHDIFRSLLVRFHILGTTPDSDNFPISQEEEEETEVLSVTSRGKQQTSTGRRGGTN